MTRSPVCTKAGMTLDTVVTPAEYVMAASRPRNSAKAASTSKWGLTPCFEVKVEIDGNPFQKQDETGDLREFFVTTFWYCTFWGCRWCWPRPRSKIHPTIWCWAEHVPGLNPSVMCLKHVESEEMWRVPTWVYHQDPIPRAMAESRRRSHEAHKHQSLVVLI